MERVLLKSISIGEFREIMKTNDSFKSELSNFRKSLKDDKWKYNAYMGILAGTSRRHATGDKHLIEQNLGIGQGDNGNHTVKILEELNLINEYNMLEHGSTMLISEVEELILGKALVLNEIVLGINKILFRGTVIDNTLSSDSVQFISSGKSNNSVKSVDTKDLQNVSSVWKKQIPNLQGQKELSYTEINQSVTLEKENFKYRGDERVRYKVYSNYNKNEVLFSFTPDFVADNIEEAWLWNDSIWMICTCGHSYSKKNIEVRSIKINGRKSKLCYRQEDFNCNRTIYCRMYYLGQNQNDFLFVLRGVHSRCYLRYDSKKGKGISTITKDFDLWDFKVFDGDLIISGSSLCVDGEEILPYDYLDIDAIECTVKEYYFKNIFPYKEVFKGYIVESSFSDAYSIDSSFAINFSKTHVSIDSVVLSMRNCIPNSITIKYNADTFVYNEEELMLTDKSEYDSQNVCYEKYPSLGVMLNALIQDKKWGYTQYKFMFCYTYAVINDRVLFACKYQGCNYVGIYDDSVKCIMLKNLDKSDESDRSQWNRIIEGFDSGILFTFEQLKSFFSDVYLSKESVINKYQIDNSNGKGLIKKYFKNVEDFFVNRSLLKAQEISNSALINEWGKINRFRGSLDIHCVGFVYKDSLYCTYPLRSNNEIVPDSEIEGVVVVVDSNDVYNLFFDGIFKPLVVWWDLGDNTRIRVCKNVEFKSLSDWWKRVWDKFVEYRNEGAPARLPLLSDIDSFVPSLSTPNGLRILGISSDCDSSGFTGGDISIIVRWNDETRDSDPMKHIFHKYSIAVEFNTNKIKGVIAHPLYQNLRAVVLFERGIIFIDACGEAWVHTVDGRKHKLWDDSKADIKKKACGVKYERGIVTFILYEGLSQFEYNQHEDVNGYMDELWRDSYHVKVSSLSYDIKDFLSMADRNSESCQNSGWTDADRRTTASSAVEQTLQKLKASGVDISKLTDAEINQMLDKVVDLLKSRGY